jgi:quercetin dioxygenase-like cupin family protein
MKRYFFDMDNTLCRTTASDYANSQPIQERINWLHQLKDQGHHITIWTARGQTSGLDHRALTEQQLATWQIPYDELLMGKPHYDVYYDDKSHNIDTVFPLAEGIIPPVRNLEGGAPTIASEMVSPIPSKKLASEIVPKGWGREIIFVNNPEYCGKILCFDAGKKFSMHYHVLKKETWYVAKGSFVLHWIDTVHGIPYSEVLVKGDVITNERGEPHQLVALEDAEVFEVSTRHYDEDSYRIRKGD